MSRRGFLVVLLVLGASVGASPGSAEHSEGDVTPPVWIQEYSGMGIRDAVAVPGGYVLVGHRGPSEGPFMQGWATGVDRSGGVVWARSVNSSNSSALYGVDRLPRGDVVAVGRLANGRSVYDYREWVVRFDEDGDVAWDATFGNGVLFDVVATPDGGAVAVGRSWRPSGAIALRIDPDGEVRWRKPLGGRRADAVVRHPTGDGYLVAGTGLGGLRADEAARLTALSADGTVRWDRIYGGNTSGAIVVRPRPGGFVVAGGQTVILTDHRGVATEVRRLDWLDGDVLALRATSTGEYVIGLGSGEGSGGIVRVGSDWQLRRHVRERRDHPVGRVEALVPTDRERYLAVGATRPLHGSGLVGFAHLTDQVSPAAGLSADPPAAETGITEVTLDASASSDNTAIEQYRWDFNGDGQLDVQTTEPTVTHVYRRIGTVNATVTVVDAAGNRANSTASVALSDTIPPTANLSAPLPRLVATTAPARLNASASSDNHRIAEYRWDFDADGSVDATIDDPGVRYQFSAEPHHEVELTVVDDVGHVTSRTVSLRTAPNDGPPNVTIDVGFAVIGDWTYFEANATDRVGTPTVTWTFPDGNRTTGTVATHVFDQPGRQTVSVVVADEYGAERRKNLTVDVKESYPPDTAGVGLIFVPILLGLLVLLGLILVPAILVALIAATSGLRGKNG